jgi:hypothetical protein
VHRKRQIRQSEYRAALHGPSGVKVVGRDLHRAYDFVITRFVNGYAQVCRKGVSFEKFAYVVYIIFHITPPLNL